MSAVYHALNERQIIVDLLHESRQLADKLADLGYLDESYGIRLTAVAALQKKFAAVNTTIADTYGL